MSRIAEFKIKANLLVSVLNDIETTKHTMSASELERRWQEVQELAREIQRGIPPTHDAE